MSALRIEPIQQPETECTEYSIIDEAGEEIAVVTGKAWALKFAAADELFESLKRASDELAQYVDLQQKLDYIEYAADTQKKLDAIDAVIAKAEGYK